MYRLIRNTHLLLGLSGFAFLLMYGLSAVQMAHNAWFNLKPAVTEARYTLAPSPGRDARSVAQELMNRHAYRGELNQIRVLPDHIRFRITRPGTVSEVDYAQQTGEAQVRTSHANFIGMLNRIHHLAGLRHEMTVLNIWGIFVALVSLILIGIALTGIYLWFSIHEERLPGAILLAISLGFSLSLIVAMRLA